MKKQLTIQEYNPKPKTEESNWNWGNGYYDLETGILIRELSVEQDLKPNIIYEFTFEDDEDIDAYYYVVLKKLTGNKYLVSEFYYNDFYSIKNKNLLGDSWIFIKDFEEEFCIDFDRIRQGIVDYYE